MFKLSVLLIFSFMSIPAFAQITSEEYQHRAAAHKETVMTLCGQVYKAYVDRGMVPTGFASVFKSYFFDRCREHDNSKVKTNPKFVKRHDLDKRLGPDGKIQAIPDDLAPRYGVYIPEETAAGKKVEARKALDGGTNKVDDAIAAANNRKHFPGMKKISDLPPNLQIEFLEAKNALLQSPDSLNETLRKMRTPGDPLYKYNHVLKSPDFMQNVMVELGDEAEHIVDLNARYHEESMLKNLVAKQTKPMIDGTKMYERGKPFSHTADYIQNADKEVRIWGEGSNGDPKQSPRISRMAGIANQIEITDRKKLLKKIKAKVTPEVVEARYAENTQNSYYAKKRAQEAAIEASKRATSTVADRAECLARELAKLETVGPK